jgi:hypothetical protein
MSRLRLDVALSALLALAVAPAAHAHQGNPNYRSVIDQVSPKLPGVRLQVLNLDDRLELHNTSGKTVVVKGYQGEPYARILGDGTVQVNHNSPAFYLNDDRTSTGMVPASAKTGATPDWQVVDRAGRFQWHDHRIHWMSTIDPPRVREAKDEPHHVFDWTVPGSVDGQPLAIRGSLDYRPAPKSSFNPLLVAPAVALLLAAAVIWWLRRRRSA